MEQINTTDRLRQLRELMKSKKIDVYVVPSEDAHASEYIAPIDGRREFISGFDGSAGTAVITSDKAALATDGRYFNQASQQLDNNWTLLKQGLQDVPTWQEWAVEQAEGGKTVGVDATTIASPDARKLLEKIKKEGGKDLVALTDNLVDQVWGKDRPARPSKPVKVQKLEHSGKAFQDKIDELRKDIEKKKAAGFVVSMLDDIAWLFNLRGSDIPMNPVFFSYAVITPTTASLYIDDSKLDQEAKDHLKGVTIRPYEAIFSDISALVTSESTNNGADKPTRKYLISTRASWALANALGGEKNVEEIRSLIGDAKAVKNEVEMQGMRDCHVRDGAALTQYFAWLEEELITKKTKLDEVDAANKLAEIRATKDMFVGCSFDTISASGPNAAIMHYNPQPGSCSVIDPTKIYLCDSGAQYTDGTTDTTRTLHFGTPTEKEIETYTLVLKGHIAMDMAVFPKGTSGFALDVLARQFLWQNGLEYRHGTGHGVGSFLNVHEGPIGIGTRISYTEVPLAIGNVISNEPGYYEDGSFGIRIENMFMVKEVKTKHKFGDKPYFGFEYVTMVPMCRKLVNLSMLTEVEKNWLNTYHQKVSEKLKPLLAKDELSLKWLERECATY
ncbi:Putative aminopeptidase P, cytoplasmic [Acrodontium crateriforme]|uniref:Probable Xaa-Pro aminopeptidase P n=1 Tax=Acrodontium crateriforme TaxID=150365 RepID=A0AAQ3M461_9PEZI|nr:Putative aminopeptidase P, cytoplasmic [Acrodontium crateriforme]